jgi:hypothetical protein
MICNLEDYGYGLANRISRAGNHKEPLHSMSTRRRFLLECSTAVAGLALMPACAMAGTGAWAPGPMSYAGLARQINTVFRVRQAGGEVRLTLLRAALAPPTPVRPGRRPPGDAGNEKFSLIFSGPKETRLESAIHRFEHDELGRFEMHLGPVGAPKADGVRYEAVFNQPSAAKGRADLS